MPAVALKTIAPFVSPARFNNADRFGFYKSPWDVTEKLYFMLREVASMWKFEFERPLPETPDAK